MHGRIIKLAHESKCLAGNILGDPTAREVFVYLPPGYDQATRDYPSVMLLPGFAATHHNIVGYGGPWKKNTVELFDDMVASGDSPAALLVMPDCMTRWGGSQFVDSAAMGAYQTYLADEVIPLVNAEVRSIPGREGWAVAGRSSGGFGALRLGMDRPETVSVIGTHAGDAAFDISMRPMLTKAAIAIEQAGGLEAFAARVVDGGPKGGGEFDAIFVLAASAAYAPEPGAPCPHLALPFDARTGDLDESTWARWLANDPVELLADPSGPAAQAMARMSLVFVDAGDRDEHGLQFAARRLTERLSAAGAKTVSEEYPGGHRGTSYRYERSLPVMIEALAQG